MTINTVVAGTTKTLRGYFELDGVAVDLDNVQVTIYDKWRGEIEIITSPVSHDTVGDYSIVYTFPTDYDQIVIEFKGNYEGKPTITRRLIDIVWTDPEYDVLS